MPQSIIHSMWSPVPLTVTETGVFCQPEGGAAVVSVAVVAGSGACALGQVELTDIGVMEPQDMSARAGAAKLSAASSGSRANMRNRGVTPWDIGREPQD